ncbi:MAG: polysaccharide deacetylase family protein [Deltaproteobacteria bacterium]|nr:polysaccharide deacetylase family protein [Deltaproteobacteria bacterium]
MAISAHAGDGFVLDLMVMNQPMDKVLADVERAHGLGATHFNIPVLLCQKNKNANELYWCGDFKWLGMTPGETDDYKARVITLGRELKARGFNTGLLPMILSKDDGAWRGFFEPTDFQAWGKSYLGFLNEMADIAQSAGVTDFIIGTELNRLYIASNSAEQARRSAYWRQTAAAMRQRLGAGVSVIIVANWDQYDQIPFWDASDFIGLSAYYPLASGVTDDTSVASLTARWKKWQSKLVAVATRHKRQLYFSEVGYSSEENAAREPWGWTGKRDVELQKRLYESFANTWASGSADAKMLVRFQLWALSISDDPNDTGFDIFGKPAEAALSAAFLKRRHPELAGGRLPRVPVVFTIDDLPMWFVSDIHERASSLEQIRETLARHHVPAVAFLNPSSLEASDWQELHRWQGDGATLGNHTAHHLARSGSSEADFLADVDLATVLMKQNGAAPARQFFRYPNLDFGAGADAAVATCRAIRARGFDILPTSFDTTDWSWGESYHHAAGTLLANRPEAGMPAQRIAEQALRTIDSRFAAAPKLLPSALLMMMHSTRFTRDYLENVLTRLELQGATWVAPTPDVLGAYAPGDDCLPACKKTGACF